MLDTRDNSFLSFPTNQNSNEFINNGYNANTPKGKKVAKKVKFNDTVVIYNVESFKDLNKKLCYNEEEGLAEFYREFPFGYNNGKGFGPFGKYQGSTIRNPNVTRKNVNSECCSII